MNGGDGTDILYGGSEDDILLGEAGTDRLFGDNGSDAITGGAGADTMTGGNDVDIFNFGAGETGITQATADVITDFVSGADRLDFTGAAGTAANYAEAATAVADFAAALTAANTALAGTVIYSFQFDATNGYLFFDNDGDNDADEVIVLSGIDNTEIAFGDIIV